jgi:hypothetical protein
MHLEFIYVLLDAMFITTTTNTNICWFRTNPRARAHTHTNTRNRDGQQTMPETASDTCNPGCSNFQIVQIHTFISLFPHTHYTMYRNEPTRRCCHTVFNVFTLIKCTLVQALRLCTGRRAHRGSRGIALLFHHQRH